LRPSQNQCGGSAQSILGIVRPRNGTVEFAGEDVTDRNTSYRIKQGMAIVPENRLFAPMTVRENLEMGAYLLGRALMSPGRTGYAAA